MIESTYWCAKGQHAQPGSAFRWNDGKRATACMACERATLPPMTGVDIDAIHFKLGAVRPGYRPRR